MHLFLIGYRGSGKTTVARLLADRLQRNWVDSDVWIEQHAGRTIREIFAEDGETGFRDWETQAIQQISSNPQPLVIALGGGAILREQNRRLLRELGHTVWLQAEPEQLARRIAGDQTTADRRPSLTGLGVLEEIQTVLKAREPLYREAAQWIIQTASLSPEDVADTLIEQVPALRAEVNPPVH